MVQRDIIEKLRGLMSVFSVITVTGTRQCGKSTLLKNYLPDYKYISLEDIDIRQLAKTDPRGFLNNFGYKLIIDEAQYVPELFSYIQTEVDKINDVGMYVLSGSHDFLLMESVSQSLAGRVAVLRLAPFSISELSAAGLLPSSVNEYLFMGGYPRIYDKHINPADYFSNYIQTYIERDVRLLRNITNLSCFIKFIKLCAARIGQLLNINDIANQCDISIPTAKSWLSVLESSYVVYLLKPYYNNYSKRLVKSPKLYFYDTGLAVSLLGINSSEQIELHYMRGQLFENMVVSEFIKKFYFRGVEPPLYFWRDSNQNEVDLLVDTGLTINAFEIKSSATLNTRYFNQLNRFKTISGLPDDNIFVIYAGDNDYNVGKEHYIAWKNIR